MRIGFEAVSHDLFEPFRISRRTYTHADTLRVVIEKDGIVGRGEAAGLDYHGETVAVMLGQAEPIANHLAEGGRLDRELLQALLPRCGARNAIDCALWDLEAKSTGVPAAVAAGLPALRPLRTTITLGMDEPDRMAAKALRLGPDHFIKIKLGDDADLERLKAIHAAVPSAELVVDANQAWSFARLAELSPYLAQIGVKLIEQPLPAEDDGQLREYDGPVPLCADEACSDRRSLASVTGKYSFINIKLDKSGGLTEALLLAREARALGLRLMVGCMEGTSLCIAPAFLVGQFCEVVDLDCPLLLKEDIADGMRYEGHSLQPYDRALWG